jgi:hypothetical protein
MAEDDQVDRLRRRLNWEGVGPLEGLTNQAADALAARVGEFATWVREMGEDRPLTSILIALQIGFAAGRWGPRRAKH